MSAGLAHTNDCLVKQDWNNERHKQTQGNTHGTRNGLGQQQCARTANDDTVTHRLVDRSDIRFRYCFSIVCFSPLLNPRCYIRRDTKVIERHSSDWISVQCTERDSYSTIIRLLPAASHHQIYLHNFLLSLLLFLLLLLLFHISFPQFFVRFFWFDLVNDFFIFFYRSQYFSTPDLFARCDSGRRATLICSKSVNRSRFHFITCQRKEENCAIKSRLFKRNDRRIWLTLLHSEKFFAALFCCWLFICLFSAFVCDCAPALLISPFRLRRWSIGNSSSHRCWRFVGLWWVTIGTKRDPRNVRKKEKI